MITQASTLIWVFRLALVAACSSLGFLMIRTPLGFGSGTGMVLSFMFVLSATGLLASYFRRPFGMWVFLTAFLIVVASIWLSVDLLILKGTWWEWPIAVIVQMGIPVIIVWYALMNRDFRSRYNAP